MGPLDHPWAKRVGATVGLVGSIGVAGWYSLVAGLSAPFPWVWLFVGAGGVGIVFAIRWWGPHPWRAFMTPIVTFVLLTIASTIGESLWGWGP
jgi:hypothetical protein